jgi:hypothetical protein
MADSSLPSDARLPELLAARARSASDGRLALDLAGGLVAAGAALAWRPSGWLVLLSAALCFAAFGAWGIADREARERPPGSRGLLISLLRGVRALAALVGAAAAVTLLFATLALALGTWIS